MELFLLLMFYAVKIVCMMWFIGCVWKTVQFYQLLDRSLDLFWYLSFEGMSDGSLRSWRAQIYLQRRLRYMFTACGIGWLLLSLFSYAGVFTWLLVPFWALVLGVYTRFLADMAKIDGVRALPAKATVMPVEKHPQLVSLKKHRLADSSFELTRRWYWR